MSQPNAIDCIFEQILGFMLPFYLAAAGGDAKLAREAIFELVDAYDCATPTELELVGRILGFSTVAMDNLRLSMKPDMSDAKILRYRSNAVALSRAGEQCRKILEVIQGKRKPADKPAAVPRPSIAPAPEVRTEKPLTQTTPAKAPPVAVGGVPLFPMDLESMRQGARVMLGAFANGGLPDQAGAAFPRVPDKAAMLDAAIKEAIGASKRSAAA
nr:hypothetical protein [uncultured Rhodopila sp.]